MALENPSSAARSFTAGLRLLLFLAALFVPGVMAFVAPSGPKRSGASGENTTTLPALPRRWPQVVPALSQLRAYVGADFGFRQTLIEWNALLRIRYLRMSSTPRVVMGSGDWVFYGSDGHYHFGEAFTEAELTRWASTVRSFRDWLALRHIRLVVFVAPSKQAIYPEAIPRWALHADVPQRTDQLLERLARDVHVDVVDARPALLAARHPESRFSAWPLYLYTDTHWNDLGGFLGARELTRELNHFYPSAPIPRDEEARLELEPHGGGDLSVMLGMESDQLPDRGVKVSWPHPLVGRIDEYWPDKDPRVTHSPGAPFPPTIFFRDSFANTMIPNTFKDLFVEAHYKRTMDFELEWVEQLKPQLVVWEFIDRRLWEPLPSPPYELFPLKPVVKSSPSPQNPGP